jgi:hypothetical protein
MKKKFQNICTSSEIEFKQKYFFKTQCAESMHCLTHWSSLAVLERSERTRIEMGQNEYELKPVCKLNFETSMT